MNEAEYDMKNYAYRGGSYESANGGTQFSVNY